MDLLRSTSRTERLARALGLGVTIAASAGAASGMQAACPGPYTGTTVLVSRSLTGGVGDFDSFDPDISGDGRYVVFATAATNLIAGDTNGLPDIHLFDRVTGTQVRLTQSASGVIANGDSRGSKISQDGMRVLFSSTANNLVPGDSNGRVDVFVADWATGSMWIASKSSTGVQANLDSFQHSISSTGRWIAFASKANNIVPGDTNANGDTFVHDALLGTTERVSLTAAGLQSSGNAGGSAVSGDGRFVVFGTAASDIVPGDLNGLPDTFVRDRVQQTTTLVSRALQGGSANGVSTPDRISDDGQQVLFSSTANNLVLGDSGAGLDAFLFNNTTQVITRMSLTHDGQPPNAESFQPVISRDGRWVNFFSPASNIVPNDTNGQIDGFLVDRVHGTLLRPTVTSGGCEGNSGTGVFGMSDDARFLVMLSSADNLTPEGNPLHRGNIYLRDQAAPGPQTYCVPHLHSQACLALVSSVGVPSASAASGFLIQADRFVGSQPALFFYGSSGSTVLPLGPAALCVRPPLRRTTLLSTSGQPIIPCDGTVAFDFNAWRTLGHDPSLIAGATIWGQFWSRDPSGTGPRSFATSDALVFTLAP